MMCPYCKSADGEVVYTRHLTDRWGEFIRRRRMCRTCGYRWFTRERGERSVDVMHM